MTHEGSERLTFSATVTDQGRVCRDCKRTLPADQYYYAKKNCKECVLRGCKLNREAKRDQYLAYDRTRRSDPEYMERVRARQRRYIRPKQSPDRIRAYDAAQKARHPEKVAARTAVMDALRTHRLSKGPCSVCGVLRVHAHHPDYSKPLEVVWLCPQHHHDEHRRLRAKAKA